MTGYRRLISYIYAYEGEEKGKNIGFVKLESRNGQCRLSVNVKKIYAGGNDIGVYLIASGREIPLGNIFIRNGCGEFRTIINVENVMGTGNSLDSCIGLVIHEKGEEAVAQAAELELAEAAEKKPDDTQERDKRLKKQIEELNREIDEAAKVGDNIAEKENVEKESAAEGNAAEDTAPAASGAPQNTSEPKLLQQLQPSGDPPKQPSADQSPQLSADQWVQPSADWQSQPPADQLAQPPADRNSQPPTDQQPQSPQSSSSPFIQSTQQEEIPLGDPKALEHLDAEEEKWGPEVLWDRFRKHYPKMQAFDSPQDIGLLPRENWGYGNNSFLLHGYYNYRYLIFARVGDEKHTRARYILGVPGHYYSNEKYMASMFGFPHFVLAKTQPAQDGRFGYWYADVRMENVE